MSFKVAIEDFNNVKNNRNLYKMISESWDFCSESKCKSK